MAKKLIKHGEHLALVIDKAVLESLGINEKSDLEMIVMSDTLFIKHRKGSAKSAKIRQAKLEDSANRIMDKYESVFKKLAKT